MIYRVLAVFALLIGSTLTASTALAAEGPDLELIMSDPDWMGNAPTGAYWSDSGDRIYYEQKRVGESFNDLYVVPAAGGDAERVGAADEAASSNATRVYNDARSMVAWIHRGDVMVKDLKTGEVSQITRTAAEESRPQFMADGQTVAYLRGGEYFVHDTVSGLTADAADARFESDPDKESFDVLRRQMRTIETLQSDKRREEARKAHAESRQRKDPAGAPLPIYLGTDYREVSRSLSPSGRHLLLVVEKQTKDSVSGMTKYVAEGGDRVLYEGETGSEYGRAYDMPKYVTESGYATLEEVRTLVGRKVPPAQFLLLVDLEAGSFDKLDYSALPGIDDDPLRDLRGSAYDWYVERGADPKEVEEALEPPDQRPLTVQRIAWNSDGSRAAVELRSIDNKDRWLVTIDPARGKLETRHRLTDNAWINWDYNAFGWMDDDRTLWYLSEESGYSQLYTRGIDAGSAKQLTRGDFEVREVVLGPRGRYFYVVANRTHPGNYEVYRVAADGGDLEQVTSLGGVVAFTLSPSGERLLLSRSYIDRHEDLYVQAANGEGDVQRLTDTMSDRYKSIDWVVPEIVEVPSSHVDKPIYSKLYLPKDYKEGETYPAVMFVHGAGYTQNSHMGWPYYFREFMFHTILANDGFIVLDMDYRASKGYGRDWRTAIYRNMGHPELQDLEDGVDWMVENYGVDRDRIGVYGGSYGGFMTFMALFRAPDLFAAGAALRPVADWMHYNHEYTSNILNTPLVDPVAYQRSSPINFVENLTEPLLIASGMQDDNVFFQDSVMVVERLIELKKEDFQIAIYPLDPHGFVHPESWLDEYRRVYKLMQRNLQ